jgi:hypothetical protein
MITQSWSNSCSSSGTYNAQINITNSTLRYSARPGIQLFNATGVAGNITVRNSTISNNAGDGIQITGQFTPTVSGSSFLNNSGSGIVVNHGQPVSITNNILSNNGAYAAAVNVNGQLVSIADNSGTGNHYHGMFQRL